MNEFNFLLFIGGILFVLLELFGRVTFRVVGLFSSFRFTLSTDVTLLSSDLLFSLGDLSPDCSFDVDSLS